PSERGVDLGNQLALAIAGTQFDRPFGLQRGPVGQIRLQQALFLEVPQGARRIGKEFGAPSQQLLPEILGLERVHKLFVVAGTIIWRQIRTHHSPQTPSTTGAEYMNRVRSFQPSEKEIS